MRPGLRGRRLQQLSAPRETDNEPAVEGQEVMAGSALGWRSKAGEGEERGRGLHTGPGGLSGRCGTCADSRVVLEGVAHGEDLMPGSLHLPSARDD